jgi:glycerophosphoryl diester phosphodiesterase
MELRRPEGGMLRIGHRGAAALEPENTLASFSRAVELGVDMIEFDVIAHPGGGLALAHSADVLVAGSPMLEDALSFFEQVPEIGLHVDLKLADGAGQVAQVVTALRRHGLLERSFVSSFSAPALRTVGAAAPEIPLGLSYPENGWLRAPLRWAVPWRIGDWLERVGASAAVLHRGVVSKAVVERCHRLNAAVIVWTVDDSAGVRRLARMGVDGVVTNDPRVFAATLAP